MAKAAATVKPTKMAAPAAPVGDGGKGAATTSLVFGILSFVLNIIPFLWPILAIVYANKAKAQGANGMATAGKVLGIIGIVLQALGILLIIILFATGAFAVASYGRYY